MIESEMLYPVYIITLLLYSYINAYFEENSFYVYHFLNFENKISHILNVNNMNM